MSALQNSQRPRKTTMLNYWITDVKIGDTVLQGNSSA